MTDEKKLRRLIKEIAKERKRLLIEQRAYKLELYEIIQNKKREKNGN